MSLPLPPSQLRLWDGKQNKRSGKVCRMSHVITTAAFSAASGWWRTGKPNLGSYNHVFILHSRNYSQDLLRKQTCWEVKWEDQDHLAEVLNLLNIQVSQPSESNYYHFQQRLLEVQVLEVSLIKLIHPLVSSYIC